MLFSIRLNQMSFTPVVTEDSFFTTTLATLFTDFLYMPFSPVWDNNIIVLICIFLIMNDNEHFFMSIFNLYHFGRNAHLSSFLDEVVEFCCWVLWVLFTSWILALYLMYYVQNFSPIQLCIFSIVWDYFGIQKHFFTLGHTWQCSGQTTP